VFECVSSGSIEREGGGGTSDPKVEEAEDEDPKVEMLKEKNVF
jgi:hypothetical protein